MVSWSVDSVAIAVLFESVIIRFVTFLRFMLALMAHNRLCSTIKFSMTEHIDQYAVIGHPVSHSLSPRIHTLFAEQTAQDLNYVAIDAPPEEFNDTVRNFQQRGGRGMNVTVPYKQQAFALCDKLSTRARRAGAVNTLVIHSDGGIEGDTTDGVGLVRDLLVNHATQVEGARVLIAGAGGAVRGVLEPLMQQRPRSLTIANRTLAKALELAEIFSSDGPINGCAYDDLAGQRFDIIINGTASGLTGEVPPIPDGVLADGGVTYDMMYGTQPTAFVRWGQTQGARLALDGLGMLVEQAAESFHIWRGVRPETSAIITSLRS